MKAKTISVKVEIKAKRLSLEYPINAPLPRIGEHIHIECEYLIVVGVEYILTPNRDLAVIISAK